MNENMHWIAHWLGKNPGLVLLAGILGAVGVPWFLANLALKRTSKHVVRYIGQYFGPVIALSLFCPFVAVVELLNDQRSSDDQLTLALTSVATVACWIGLWNIVTWKIVVSANGFERFRFFYRKRVQWDDIRRMRFSRWPKNIVCDLKDGGKIVCTIYTHNLSALLEGASLAGVEAVGFELPKFDTFD